MRKPLYGRMFYAVLKDGHTGYYERFMSVDYRCISNARKPEIYKGYRTMFPERDEYSFIELKDIKYWVYVFDSTNKENGYNQSKGKKVLTKEELKENVDKFIAFEHDYWKRHIDDLKREPMVGEELRPELVAWNAWIDNDPEGVCEFFTNWIEGFWWADGEIDDPTLAVSLFWKNGFKYACELIHEGKMEVSKKEEK